MPSERRRRPRPDGTGALGPRWVRGAPGSQGHGWSPAVTSGDAEPQVGQPSSQAARATPAAGSDCVPSVWVPARAQVCVRFCCQQNVSNRTWRTLASHVRTVEASGVYLRCREVEAWQCLGTRGRGEVFTRQRPQGLSTPQLCFKPTVDARPSVRPDTADRDRWGLRMVMYRGRGRRYGYGRPGRRVRGYYRARSRTPGPIPGCLLLT